MMFSPSSSHSPSSTPAGAVLSLGRIYCHLAFDSLPAIPRSGQEIFAGAFAFAPGGGALTTATHIAAMGRPVALVTRLGDDRLSQVLERQIEELGLDLRYLDRTARGGPQITVSMGGQAGRAVLSHRSGSARPDSFEAALAWFDAAHLHIAEYGTLYEMSDAIWAAKAQGLTVSLDPCCDEELVTDSLFLQRAAGTDIFLTTLERARLLTKCDDPPRILAALRYHFPIVVLKCGAGGAMLAMEDETVTTPCPRPELFASADTDEACAAFNGSFLHGWLGRQSPVDCIAAAIATAAEVLEAQHMQAHAALERFR